MQSELAVLLALAHDSLGNGLRNLDVVARLHYILAAALGLGTKVIGVTEHLRKRNKSSNLNGTISGLLVLDLSTSGVEVADYVTDVIIRNDNVNTHDRLEDYGVSLSEGFLDSHRTSDLERHFRRVDFMIRTVVQGNLDVYYRIACEDTGVKSALDTCVNGGNELLRDRAADNVVAELITLTGLVRLNSDLNVTVLTRTTGLALILHINIGIAGDGLLISNLRCAYVSLNLELTEQSVNDDIEVKLTHTSDDRLTGLPGLSRS